MVDLAEAVLEDEQGKGLTVTAWVVAMCLSSSLFLDGKDSEAVG